MKPADLQKVIDQIKAECEEVVVHEADEFGPELRELCRECGVAVKVLGWLRKRQLNEAEAREVTG